MRNRIIIIGQSVIFLSSIAPPVLAQVVPTLNQPDNGFYEGPSPEWAALHSTDSRGTEVHRQYHRDAVRDLNAWLQQYQDERGTTAYDEAHRIVVQERNMLHRQFHSVPVTVNDSSLPFNFEGDAMNVPNTSVNTSAIALASHMNGARPTRRSIVLVAEEQNRLRQQ